MQFETKACLTIPFPRQSVSDRFYQALYAKLLDPSLKTSSKQVRNTFCFFRLDPGSDQWQTRWPNG